MYKYSLEELRNKANILAFSLYKPHVILLNGNLGTGKTTFAQFFLKCILIRKDTTIFSPTFTIINTYNTIKGEVWHIDLYRINNIEEIFQLGILEFIQNGIAIIEWPEKIMPYIKNIPNTVINL